MSQYSMKKASPRAGLLVSRQNSGDARVAVIQRAPVEGARLIQCHAGKKHRRWCGNGHQNPTEEREEQTHRGRGLQIEHNGYLPQMQTHKSPMLQGLNVMNDRQREDKSGGGDGGRTNKHYIHSAMKTLTAAAICALREMVFIVAAH